MNREEFIKTLDIRECDDGSFYIAGIVMGDVGNVLGNVRKVWGDVALIDGDVGNAEGSALEVNRLLKRALHLLEEAIDPWEGIKGWQKEADAVVQEIEERLASYE